MTDGEGMAITPDIMLRAYSIGLFPMAPDAESAHLDWYDPDMRGILPLDAFHVPRRLLRTVLSDRFDIVADRHFEATIRACAAPAPGRETTWINERIVRLFCDLHDMGYAHSVESWQDGVLVGGLYGVAIGGAFFGESMFSRRTDASKPRWCRWWRGCGSAGSRCSTPVRHRAPGPVRRHRNPRLAVQAAPGARAGPAGALAGGGRGHPPRNRRHASRGDRPSAGRSLNGGARFPCCGGRG